jgi:hypothetical protein
MNKIKPLLLIFAAALSAYIALSFLILPGFLHARVKSFLNQAGFDTAHITRPSAGLDFILYRDTAFDSDSLNTARAIRVIFEPMTLLTTGQFRALEIYGLTLTGEWKKSAFDSLFFPGWNPSTKILQSPLPFSRISVRDASLSLLTQTMGGISVDIDLNGSGNDNAFKFQGNIQSGQRYLSLNAAIDGSITGNNSKITLAIENAKIEHPGGDYKFTRISGKIDIAYAANATDISGQIQAGGGNIFGLPINNILMKPDFTNGALNIALTGTATGNSDIKIDGNISILSDASYSGKIKILSDKKTELTNILKDHKSFDEIRAKISKNKNAGPVEFEIQNGRIVP